VTSVRWRCLRWGVLIACAMLAQLAYAHQTPINWPVNAVEGVANISGLALLRERDPALGIDAISATENASRFKLAPDIGEHVLGYTTEVLWLRFRLVNDSEKPIVSLLQTGAPRMRDVRLYSRSSDGRWQERRSGLDVPVQAREVPSRHPVFMVSLPAGESREYYLRVQSGNAIHVFVRSWKPVDFSYRELEVNFKNALQLGAEFMLAVYGLILFFGTRNRSYFYFFLLLASYGLYEISIYQYGHQYLWKESPDWAMRAPGVFMTLAALGNTLLIARLLRTRETMPTLHVVLRSLLVASLVLLPMMVSIFYAYAVMPGMVICLAMISASLYGTVVALLRGHRQARMLLPVFMLFCAVAMLRIGTFMGVLPAWWLMEYTHGWTVVLAGLLMTLSLIDKVLDVNLERMRVQQELLRGQVRAREQLESEVQSRTAELQDAKEKAERADASKSRFLAQLSHELRTPLHSVLGNAGLMLGEKRNEDDSRRLQAMQRSGRHLLALIEEVLEFVRGDAGRTELTVRPVWLRDLLKGVVEEMQPLSRTSSVNLLLQVDPELPDGVVLDPVRLRQVLINLVGNACRHSHGTVVSVQAHLVSADEDSVILRFEIHDDGEGVDDGERDALFDPFWQAGQCRSA
jgi:signal transduction histidine kinase